MPLRFSDNAQPAEPIAAMPPHIAEIEGTSARNRHFNEQPAERGTLLLKIVVGGIFAYVAVMALGLCGMMFPRQSREITRSVRQAMALVRPESPRTRVVVAQPTLASTDSSVKNAPAAPRKRARRVDNSKFVNFEVVENNHKHAVAPRPPTPSVTVSVEDPKTSGSAN